ncbi:MAG: S9 family peptidase [bacterium]|nr:S9 family peptidase [bacterium]
MPRIALPPIISLLIVAACLAACAPGVPTDLARRDEVVDVLHGVEVPDPYRWLEDGSRDEVKTWTEARNTAFVQATEKLPQRQWLYDRFQHLMRYDDESTPQPCLLSERMIFRTKKADQDKWVIHLKEGPDDEGRAILDPNTWEETETLYGFYTSPDCRLAAFGKANAGDEDPVIRVIDLDTLEMLPDTLRGWKQMGASWLHDNSGFYYGSFPLEGEVPEGEHHYWHRVWFHRLGTPAEEDQLFFSGTEVKEHFHGADVSEDGRWMVKSKLQMPDKSELWLADLESSGEPVPIVTGMDSENQAQVIDDQVIITTDWEAPNYRVMVASVDKPGRDDWQELIPESEDPLSYVSAVAGKLYAVYLQNVLTRIAVHELDGTYLHDMPLPTAGTAYVMGYWSKPEVWVNFSSFAHPRTVYTYDPDARELTLVKESPIDIDPSGIVAEQVRYPSADGTEVSMFLVHHEAAPTNGSVPYLLTGYGGFGNSRTPRFSTLYALWIEAGGGVAIANLRGGGEYGQEWHQAGMRENKQNVFDDFLAAADWLVERGYTARDRLAIVGGSNGGLLVSAAITQRPDLCAAVLCAMPLTDMVRYHQFGLANIWAGEYGNADDPEMFEVLYAYSPYHRLTPGTDYPAMLIVGSVNDARTDPAHARKFAAAARWADADHGRKQPIVLHIQDESGHGSGVTIDRAADQTSRHFGFLMEQLGMKAPT